MTYLNTIFTFHNLRLWRYINYLLTIFMMTLILFLPFIADLEDYRLAYFNKHFGIN